MGLKGLWSVLIRASALGDGPGQAKAPFFWLDRRGGFSSIGVVIALSLTIALIFSAAQIYWINARAGDVQFAADSGALAAENVVAEYYVVARVADATILSMTLFGVIVEGVAIVVSCIPLAQEVGAQLMDLAKGVFESRDRLADEAGRALTQIQRLLPFLAAVNAAMTVRANGPQGTTPYIGIALLVPFEAENVEYPDDGDMAVQAGGLEQKNAKTAAASDKEAKAKQKMDDAKRQGWLADCGDNPNYCQYERAGHLAGLQGLENPWYASPEEWDFLVALNRARSYYQHRLLIEAPKDQSLPELIRSDVRRQYYRYAAAELAQGYVRADGQGALDIYFPPLAKNNSEIRSTRLFSDASFPLDAGGLLHGSGACPVYQAAGGSGYGSIADLESGRRQSCELCDLSINTIGRVASASTAIDNGFEYHYLRVAEAAKRYRQAADEGQQAAKEAKRQADEALDSYQEALANLKAKRLDPHPPGRRGCVVFVVDPALRSVPAGLSTQLLANEGALPPRVAISAAALVRDGTDGSNILADFLDRVRDNSEFQTPLFALGVFDNLLGLWGAALAAYSDGTDALTDGISGFLNEVPLINATPLAAWAKDAVKGCLGYLGLQGVDLAAIKPVLVNSIHVERTSSTAAITGLADIKEGYGSLPGKSSGTVSEAIFDALQIRVEEIGKTLVDQSITIFTLRFADWPGLPSIPVRLRLPAELAEQGSSSIGAGLGSLRQYFRGGDYRDVWD
ncbi:MAG: hypothetical protein FWF71_03440 [Actinomycetia bacterium]|nr:hypothetical protein [Actinomycetes bacterium]